MTELLITPNYDRKTAKFKGNAAAGERISVTIENSSDIDTATLRLRVLSHDGRMLAVFAPNVEEGLEWSPTENGISCELSLDTVEMQKAVCGMCECTLPVVLDDPDNQKLWFKSECAFQGWPKLKGGESPYDLTGFPKLIDSWIRQLGNMVVSARRVEGGVEILLWDGKGDRPAAVVARDGDKGDKGDRGDKGVGIKSIAFKSADADGGNKYEITLDDGIKYEFTAPKGPKGERGDVSAERLDEAVKVETYRATTAENEIKRDLAALVGKDSGKTIREIADAVASALISGVVDGAPEALDTLREIADWIRDDVSGAQAIVNQVAGFTEKVAMKADTTAVADLLKGKVDKDGGKGLSTNDYTNEEKDKLADIEAGAQKNPDLAPYVKKADLEGFATKRYVDDKVAEIPGGTTNYNNLSNKPKINGVELLGNKTAADLELVGTSGNQTIDGELTVRALSVYNPADPDYPEAVLSVGDQPSAGGLQFEWRKSEGSFVPGRGQLRIGSETCKALSVVTDQATVTSEATIAGAEFKYDPTMMNGSITHEVSFLGGDFKLTKDNGVSTMKLGGIEDVEAVLKNSRDKTDNLAADDTLEWDVTPPYDAEGRPFTVRKTISDDHEDIPCFSLFRGDSRVEGQFISLDVREFTWVAGVNWAGDIDVHAVASVITKSGEPYVTPTGVTALAIPKYEFVDAAITDGKVTVAPYTNAMLISDGTAFTVAVGEGDGKTRDCVLRVECGETVPTITWPTNFHPRTDAETDFKCESEVKNVYWITEYAPNEFVVAGWQETEGGSAS